MDDAGAQLGIFEGRGPVHIERHSENSSSSVQLGILSKNTAWNIIQA